MTYEGSKRDETTKKRRGNRYTPKRDKKWFSPDVYANAQLKIMRYSTRIIKNVNSEIAKNKKKKEKRIKNGMY